MEGIVTYLGFMAALLVATRLVFASSTAEHSRLVTPNGYVSHCSETGGSAKSSEGYWDYLIVSGFAGLVLIINFLVNL